MTTFYSILFVYFYLCYVVALSNFPLFGVWGGGGGARWGRGEFETPEKHILILPVHSCALLNVNLFMHVDIVSL